MELLGRDDPRAGAEQKPSRCGGVRGSLCAALTYVLVQQVFKGRTVTLEARRVDVGEVVGNDSHTRLLRIQSGLRDPKSCFHISNSHYCLVH